MIGRIVFRTTFGPSIGDNLNFGFGGSIPAIPINLELAWAANKNIEVIIGGNNLAILGEIGMSVRTIF